MVNLDRILHLVIATEGVVEEEVLHGFVVKILALYCVSVVEAVVRGAQPGTLHQIQQIGIMTSFPTEAHLMTMVLLVLVAILGKIPNLVCYMRHRVRVDIMVVTIRQIQVEVVDGRMMVVLAVFIIGQVLVQADTTPTPPPPHPQSLITEQTMIIKEVMSAVLQIIGIDMKIQSLYIILIKMDAIMVGIRCLLRRILYAA